MRTGCRGDGPRGPDATGRFDVNKRKSGVTIDRAVEKKCRLKDEGKNEEVGTTIFYLKPPKRV